MIEYRQYRDYVSHNKVFNIVFSTSVTILMNILLGIIFNSLGWLDGGWGMFIAIFLVAVPVIVFIRESTKYEGMIAYHYLWKDIFHGFLDRKMIRDDYGKAHGIKKWKEYLEEHDPDGRWNYHVYTKYMEHLVSTRNGLLVKIAEEYAEIYSGLKKDLLDIDELIKDSQHQIDTCKEELENIKIKQSKAKTGAQEFHLDKNKKIKQNELDNQMSKITQLKCQANSIKDSMNKHDIAFVAQKNKIEQDYRIRSDRYARVATKTLEKMGLRYDIEPLILPDYWINNPTRKEII